MPENFYELATTHIHESKEDDTQSIDFPILY